MQCPDHMPSGSVVKVLMAPCQVSWYCSTHSRPKQENQNNHDAFSLLRTRWFSTIQPEQKASSAVPGHVFMLCWL